jgi:hypothetical protein
VFRARVVSVVALVTLAAAACGGSEPVSQGTTLASPSALQQESPQPSLPGSVTANAAEPSSEPPSVSQPADETPTPEPTEAPAVTDEPSTAATCTGNRQNRQFFAGAAAALHWPVLCAVLPRGWFVNTGSYRLANGGRLLISYKGPGGATVALSEGAFCQASDGCVPPGSDVGSADLGPFPGTLVELADGGFAVVSDRGASPSWLIVIEGLDQATSVAIAGALARVASG